MIRALLVAALLVGCGGSAASTTPLTLASHTIDRNADLVDSPVAAYTEPPALWKSYEYIGPGDAFHLAAVSSACRTDEYAAVKAGESVSASDSGWTIDTPENPDSILALLTYRVVDELDLRGKFVDLRLQGQGLDLKGGHATFWILDGGGRWHLEVPLAVTSNKTTWTLDLAGSWHQSWFRTAPSSAPDLEHVGSYGIAFVGFSSEVTGTLVMDELTFYDPC